MGKITKEDHQVINLQLIVTRDRNPQKIAKGLADKLGIRLGEVPDNLDQPIDELMRIMSVHTYHDGEAHNA